MNRFGIFSICLLMITLMANQCKKEKDGEGTGKNVSNEVKEDILSQLYDTEWYHSREEDKDGIRVYRDGSYKFPPSRGARHGFKLEKEGKVWEYGSGPTDRPTKTEGSWKLKPESNAIEIKLTKYEREVSYTLEFVSLNDNVLRLKKVDQ